MFARPPLVPTILTLIGISILCGLGTWQIKRLAWKNNLIGSFERSKENTSEIDLSKLKPKTKFQHGTLTGYFIDAPIIEMAPRTQDGNIGKYIYVPFSTQNGHSIFINLGWVPQNWNAETMHWKNTFVTLNGLIKSVTKPGYFTPKNDPPNRWYYTDLKAMNNYAAIANAVTEHTFILKSMNKDVLNSDDNLPNPIDVQTADIFKNNHKSYAIFWFSMAMTLLVIFALRFCWQTI